MRMASLQRSVPRSGLVRGLGPRCRVSPRMRASDQQFTEEQRAFIARKKAWQDGKGAVMRTGGGMLCWRRAWPLMNRCLLSAVQ